MKTRDLLNHLEKLITFKVVADAKSIQRASLQLGITQPAITRTIQILESALSVKLMNRTSRGVDLTADGTQVYQLAKGILNDIEKFDLKADSEMKSPSKSLKVMTYDVIANHILPEVIQIWLSTHPKVSIQVQRENSQILASLIAEKVDCAILSEPRRLSGLKFEKLFQERYGFFISKKQHQKHFSKSAVRLTTQNLKPFQLIAMPDGIAGANRNVDRLLWEIGKKSPISVNSYEVGRILALRGVGVGILPMAVAKADVESEKLVELKLTDVSQSSFGAHDFYFCWTDAGAKNFDFELIFGALKSCVVDQSFAQ